MTTLLTAVNYDLLPPHTRAGMRRYIEQGVIPGSFLQAVLENDFAGALRRADDLNIRCLRDYCWFLAQVNPDAWGSPENVRRWSERKTAALDIS